MMRAASMVLVAGACGGSGVETSLAELPGLVLEVYVDSVDANVTFVRAVYDGLDERSLEDCLFVGETFAGSFRGRTMEVATRGGAGEERCEPPTLALAQTAVASNNEVVLRDDTHEARALFASTAIEARLALHESWLLPRGLETVLEWSHPPDLRGAMPRVYLDGRELAAAASDTQIAFVVPTDVATGAVDLEVHSNSPVVDDALRCQGADACRADRAGTYHHEAQIE